MDFGVHLPVIGFDGRPFTLERMLDVAAAAREGGYQTLTVNDHLVFSRPWLDGPTALAAVLQASGDMELATSIALLAVRGPVALAKSLAAIDLLSGGRLAVGVGPGSSARDYEAVGLDFEERWKRLDAGVRVLRALFAGEPAPEQAYYSLPAGLRLEPLPARQPPIWIGSWGSDAGLRRVARIADGWLASAYNTTPSEFAAGRKRLDGLLEAGGRDPGAFPDALATTFFHLADSSSERDRLLQEVVAPTINRPLEQLSDRLLVGSVEEVREKVGRYAEAGLRKMLIWPLADEPGQVAAFAREVAPAFR